MKPVVIAMPGNEPLAATPGATLLRAHLDKADFAAAAGRVTAALTTEDVSVLTAIAYGTRLDPPMMAR